MGDLSRPIEGLPDDPVAQLRAETYLRAAIAYRMKEQERADALARTAAVNVIHVDVPDESVSLIDATDRLSSDDAMILHEMRRIQAMPLPRWMRPDAGRLAS